MNVKIPVPNIGLSSLLFLIKDNIIIVIIVVAALLYLLVFNKKKGGGRPAPKPSGGGGGGGVSMKAFIRILLIGLALIFGYGILVQIRPEIAEVTNKLAAP